MKIATWNVNSVRSRVESVVAWLKEAAPDVVCLQELKCTDEQFPKEAFEGLGYNCAVHGQKTYNGVAILSKRPMEDVTPRLPGGDDTRRSCPLHRSDRADATRAWCGSPRSMRRTAIRSAPTSSRTSSPGSKRLDEHAQGVAGARGTGRADGRLQRHPAAGGLLRSQGVDGGRALSAGIARGAAPRRISGLHRRVPRLRSAAEPVHVLGLSGRRLAEGPRHPHRPHSAVAAGGRPSQALRHRQACARRARSRPTMCRSGANWRFEHGSFEGGCHCGGLRYRIEGPGEMGHLLSLPHLPAHAGRVGERVRFGRGRSFPLHQGLRRRSIAHRRRARANSAASAARSSSFAATARTRSA